MNELFVLVTDILSVALILLALYFMWQKMLDKDRKIHDLANRVQTVLLDIELLRAELNMEHKECKEKP